MPDLNELDFPLKKHLLIRALIGDLGSNRKEGLYLRNLVRLIDKAIMEYHEARSAIIAQVEEAKRPPEEMMQEGRIIYMFGFTDNFENCINTVNRLLKQLDSINSKSTNWKIPRRVRRLIEAHSKSIPDIRNATEHIAELIQRDELKEGQPVILTIGGVGDRAVLARFEVRFDELASTIRHLHQVALDLLGVDPTGNARVRNRDLG